MIINSFFFFHAKLKELKLEIMKSFSGIKLLKPFQGTVRILERMRTNKLLLFSPNYRDNPALLNSRPCVLMIFSMYNSTKQNSVIYCTMKRNEAKGSTN